MQMALSSCINLYRIPRGSVHSVYPTPVLPRLKSKPVAKITPGQGVYGSVTHMLLLRLHVLWRIVRAARRCYATEA